MSIPRLSFLYPHLFKPARLYEPTLAQRPSCAVRERPQKQCFSTTIQRAEETYAQRYGSAAEPMPPPSVPNDLGRQRALDSIEKEIVPPLPQQEREKAESNKEPMKAAQEGEARAKEGPETEESLRPSELDANEAKAQQLVNSPRREAISKPLDRVLQIETPTETKAEEDQKPPHLEAPRYVHHFDTFTLVRDLAKAGFSEPQSVTLMKAVRGLLAVNMEVARAGLVSKSDVENVLFPTLPKSPQRATANCRSPHTEKLPLPRRLLRTTHRNPQHPQILLRQDDHPACAPAARSRHSLPTLLVRVFGSKRRSSWIAQRQEDGSPHGTAAAGQRHPGT